MTNCNKFVKIYRNESDIKDILIEVNEKPYSLHLKPNSVITKKLSDIRSEDICNEVNPKARNLEGLLEKLHLRSGNPSNIIAKDEIISIAEFTLPEGFTAKEDQ